MSENDKSELGDSNAALVSNISLFSKEAQFIFVVEETRLFQITNYTLRALGKRKEIKCTSFFTIALVITKGKILVLSMDIKMQYFGNDTCSIEVVVSIPSLLSSSPKK